MATKTERILDLLPATFAAQPVNSPLETLIRTFGGELQSAENALAAIMRAHWCDQADLGAAKLNDLPKIAALYGLSPHPDDGIEEFRRRLKLWVKLLLDGPSTVRGLLRATSVILGLETDDRDEAFDAWWKRDDEWLTTTRANLRDAAPLIFGFASASSTGTEAQPARISGTVPLTDPIDLSGGAILRLAVDSGGITEIDFAADPPATSPEDIAERINDAIGTPVASFDETLHLTSPSQGTSSEIEVGDGTEDAAPALLGLRPRLFHGAEATAAEYMSPVDLSGNTDLSDQRHIRLRINGTELAEIDCAGSAPEATTPDEIRDAINAALGASIASHDGQFLTLTSPTLGVGSSIAFLAPAAQDASSRIFGPHPTVVTGADVSAATVTGTTVLSGGIDLSERARLVLDIDGGGAIDVDCAGTAPANTQLPEIVTLINAATGADTARHNGRNLIISGTESGADGTLLIGQADEGDASDLLLGLPHRHVRGIDARRAEIRGTADLSEGRDLSVRSLLRVATDFLPPQTIDLAELTGASPVDASAIAATINGVSGGPVASVEDDRLVLTSPSDGASGRLELLPVADHVTRRFVSRVPIAEDAARSLFGFVSGRAEGQPSRAAQISGTADISRGVDLRGGRFLRLSVDGAEAKDIDCAGPRPRNTTSAEVIAAINAEFDFDVASITDGKLVLTSPTPGATSQLKLEPPRATDALDQLLGVLPQTNRGSAATQVSFTGTVDLSTDVDLSTASHLNLAVDGHAPVEIDCAGPDPSTTTLSQITIAINIAMGTNIASHDGSHILLTSPTSGTGSEIAILPPASGDATGLILGVTPDRHYRGADATAAELVGLPDLSGGVDLSVARFLRLQVDTNGPIDVDCAADSDDPATAQLDDIILAINATLGTDVAFAQSGRLVLRSPSPGPSSLVSVAKATAGNAFDTLFGEAPTDASGAAGSPATLAGSVDLRNGADLSDRSLLHIAVGDALPVEIDVAGIAPAETAPDEIITAINALFPDMARLEADGTLQISSSNSTDPVAVLPARHFEVVEYPAVSQTEKRDGLHHGDGFRFRNDGAGDAEADITISSAMGAAAPGLANISTGWEVRLRNALLPGSAVSFSQDLGRVVANIHPASDDHVPRPRAHALPLAPHLDWPRDDQRKMAQGAGDRRQLTITHPEGDELLSLVEIGSGVGQPFVSVSPASEIPADDVPDSIHIGRLVHDEGALALVDADDGRIAGIELSNLSDVTRLIDRHVALSGQRIGPPDAPVIIANAIWELLDVHIMRPSGDGDPPQEETFEGVAIADARLGAASLLSRINSGPAPSGIVRAELLETSQAFQITRGVGERIYLDCLAARFDQAYFDTDRFAGGPCLEQGIFNVSRFAETPRAASTPVFAKVAGGQPADVALGWANHEPGAVEINLPLDLPARFGARFNMDHFALAEDAPEIIAGLVTEPPDDANHFAVRLKPKEAETDPEPDSKVLTARSVDTVPIGFAAVPIPFSQPVFLSGGRAGQLARLFISDNDVPGFVELSSRLPGQAGNRISVVVCDAGPGHFDLNIAFDGARFENARFRVMGPALTGAPGDIGKPGPRGVLHLKAAGVKINVTRDGTPDET